MKPNSKAEGPPSSTHDLLPGERRFVTAMQKLSFGRFEHLPIQCGELILDPWPTTVREVKFCTAPQPEPSVDEFFLLKQQVVEFFEFVRTVGSGEIRLLEIKNGLPFLLEFEPVPEAFGGCRG